MSVSLLQRWRALAGEDADALGQDDQRHLVWLLEEADRRLALIRDTDIAILGAPRDDFRAHAAGVRGEFAAYADDVYAAGRGFFLDQQLALPRLFRTDFYQAALACAARANMEWEREEMRAGRMVQA